MAKAKKVVRTRRRERKNVVSGQAHIQSTFNNTIISITDIEGNVISWGSAGAQGFKGSRKSTPFAAQVTAEATAKKALEHGMRQIEVFVRGSRGGYSLAAGDGPRGERDHRRDADPAQRLPPPETEARVDGELQRAGLPVLPPRGRQALSQGRAVLHAEVRHRAPRVRAWHARPGAQAQDVGLRLAAPS